MSTDNNCEHPKAPIRKTISPPPGYEPSTALRHMDDLRHHAVALEDELRWIAEHRSCEDNIVAANEYDALLMSSHCAWVALNALKVGCDLFEHVKNPKEPVLAEAKRAFTLGMPIVRLLTTMSELPDVKQEEIANRTSTWALSEGMVSRCVSHFFTLLLLLISCRYTMRGNEDMTLVSTPPRVLHKRGSIPPTILATTPTRPESTNAAASTSAVQMRGRPRGVDMQMRGHDIDVLTANFIAGGPPAYKHIKEEESSDDEAGFLEYSHKFRTSSSGKASGSMQKGT